MKAYRILGGLQPLHMTPKCILLSGSCKRTSLCSLFQEHQISWDKSSDCFTALDVSVYILVGNNFARSTVAYFENPLSTFHKYEGTYLIA
jgi:hypothetical protein